MESFWSGLSGIAIGIGLSAACGFRVILPFLGLSIAAMHGLIQPAPEFQWIGTWPALAALATAAILEIGAYYIPWLDNLFDAAIMPLSVAAGTLATAAVVGDLSPFMKWSLALIAGGRHCRDGSGGHITPARRLHHCHWRNRQRCPGNS